ncbi:hypothetical protein [Gorillibacterium sp. CAU 1737]|uniref:hypothetical protein n=1 Tax=Gorillibacterium sp. CAU 1737 TaxID=3140362 RepID=UPI003261078C
MSYPNIGKFVMGNIKKYLNEYNNQMKKHESKSLINVDFREIANSIHHLHRLSNVNKSIIFKKYNDNLTLSYLGIVNLSYLSLASYQENYKNPININWLDGKHCGLDPNFFLQTLVANINNAMAVIRLIESGLDTQARAMIRILAESVFSTLIVFTDTDIFVKYASARDTDEAEMVWYKYLRGPKLQQILTQIEKKVGLPEDIISELSKMRLYVYKHYSAYVHNSSSTSVIGSHAFSFTDDILHLGLGGKASLASESTIYYLNWLIYYFSLIIKGIFTHFHLYKPPSDSEIWRLAVPIRECFIQVYLQVTYKEDLGGD